MEALFTHAWCKQFATLWNRSPAFCDALAGAGSVMFVMQADDARPQRTAVLSWDDAGRLSLAGKPPSSDAPRFSGTLNGWKRFISGEASGIEAVLSGDIVFEGHMSFVINYGNDFDHLADVARRM